MKKLLLLLGLMVAFSVSVNADTVSFTAAEADNLFPQAGLTTGAPQITDTGLRSYTVAWCGGGFCGAPVFGVQTGALGVAFMGGRGMAGDTFSVDVTNDNENPWDFGISINGAAPAAFVTIPINTTVTLSVVLAGPANSAAVVVRGNLPLMGDDRTAEFHINPTGVPEPASMLLLGSGLVGLAGAARRRLRSNK